MPRRHPLTTTYRWQVASRCVAAAVGGFVLTSAACIAGAALLVQAGWATRAAATAGFTLASFAIWAAVIVWAFHTARLRRLWLNMLLPSLLLGALAWSGVQ